MRAKSKERMEAENESAESCCPLPERPVRPVKMKRKWSNKSAMLHSSEVSYADIDTILPNKHTISPWI